MAITGMSKFETEDYVSEFDSVKTEADGATVWVLGAMDAEIRAMIGDKALQIEYRDGVAIQNMNQGTRNLQAVRFGLRGWRNFPHSKTKEMIPYATEERVFNGKTYTVVSQECLDYIPGPVLGELALKIMERNSVTDDLRKKSNTQ